MTPEKPRPLQQKGETATRAGAQATSMSSVVPCCLSAYLGDIAAIDDCTAFYCKPRWFFKLLAYNV